MISFHFVGYTIFMVSYSLVIQFMLISVDLHIKGRIYQLTIASGCHSGQFELERYRFRYQLEPILIGWFFAITITAPCCRGRQTGQAPTFQEQSYDVGGWHQGGRLQPKKWVLYIVYSGKSNKTISDGGITVNFLIIKVHTSNWSSNSWGSSKSWGSSNC